MKALIIFILACVSMQSMAQVQIGVTGSKISPKDASYILEHHNKARSEVGVQPLGWSARLSAYAQAWATFLAESNNGNIKHRQFAGENGQHYGENIFWGSSSVAYKSTDASHAWYNEKANYVYDRLSDNNFYATGHCTQMVWKDTKEMGVGVAICPNGAIIVVANYFPCGNVMTQYPY
jgi:pathogenesis-related protein 1